MTKEDIKKAFVICCGAQDCTGCPILDMGKQNEHGCKFNLFMSVFDIVAEQEKEIQAAQDRILELAQECQEYREQQVKQAKIDVLNTAKERCDLVAEELEDEIDHYGSSAAYSCAYEIKKLIEEIENG